MESRASSAALQTAASRRERPSAGATMEPRRSSKEDPYLGNWRTVLLHVSPGPEGSMSRHRAADDFETIRTRIEELRRDRLLAQPDPTTDVSLAGPRGPC